MRVKTFFLYFLICLSLANLIMMKVWLFILPFRPGNSFWLPHSPFNCYLAAMLNTILIALLLWCVIFIAERIKCSTQIIWASMYAVTVCFFLNGVRNLFNLGIRPLFFRFGNVGAILISSFFILLFIAIIVLMVRNRGIIFRNHSIIPLILTPFLIVTFGQSSVALMKSEPESSFLPHKQHFSASDSIKTEKLFVVWIVFDELDYGIAFDRRPTELKLPELDRLKKVSISATHAYSPSHGTSISIPAIITGKSLINSKPLNAVEMELTSAGGATSSLQNESTIFSDVNKRGGNTALFGWYFPYARLFNNVNVVKDYAVSYYPVTERLADTLLQQLRSLSETGYFSVFGVSHAARSHILNTKSMHKDVIDYLQTSQLDFTFIHYPVPHSMFIYNRYSKKYGPNHNVKEGYLDNVALVDLLLGDIRRTMNKTKNWDKSMVLVTSDHHWRQNTYDGVIDKQRVPFLVKLPYTKEPISVTPRFETVRTREMTNLIMDRKLETPQDVADWMQLTSKIF